MSKTTEIQIEKSRNLIEGRCRHVREMGERGVSNNEINEMEKTQVGDLLIFEFQSTTLTTSTN